MFSTRCRRLLTGLMVLAASCVVAAPAGASALATYGTATAAAPSVAGCAGATCMTTSATFAGKGTLSTNVTVAITLFRTARAGGTTASSTDYVVKRTSITYSTVKGTKSSWTMSAAQKCLAVATVAYGYYTRVTVTNGTTAGTVSDSSAIRQLKGCVTV